ncbi:MgtC/SapB family protein [Parasphingopyxis marina]|nr:MgtC/SapB family protein [Parasphingopyxis marina]
MFTPYSLGWGDMLARLGSAFLFAAALGYERSYHEKPFDFRPFIMVAVTSAALVIGITEFAVQSDDPQLSIDPGKVFAGIMTGIGFLGAGALFRDEQYVRGAGSAAAIWAAGGIGIVCGLGYLWLAAVVSVILVALLFASNGLSSVHAVNGDDEKDGGD